MRKRPQYRLEFIRAVTILVFIGFGGLVVYKSNAAPVAEAEKNARGIAALSLDKEAKYTKFPHAKHKQKCSSCHKYPATNSRAARESEFPEIKDYPRHESCLNCHRRQFYAGPKPAICTVCHSNPSPRNKTRRPFPNPASSAFFAIDFPHDTHLEMMGSVEPLFRKNHGGNATFVLAGMNTAPQESCSICHETYKPQGESESEYFTNPPEDFDGEFWLKKGMFKTAPESHASCFTCHSVDTGILPAPNDCAACHKQGPRPVRADFDAKEAAGMGIKDDFVLATWRTRHSSGTFRHEFSSHAELDCASCHNAASINMLDQKTTKVDVMSCSICHITETSDDGGILNYEVDSRKADKSFQCTKCHVSLGKLPVPNSHIKAIAAQSGN